MKAFFLLAMPHIAKAHCWDHHKNAIHQHYYPICKFLTEITCDWYTPYDMDHMIWYSYFLVRVMNRFVFVFFMNISRWRNLIFIVPVLFMCKKSIRRPYLSWWCPMWSKIQLKYHFTTINHRRWFIFCVGYHMTDSTDRCSVGQVHWVCIPSKYISEFQQDICSWKEN